MNSFTAEGADIAENKKRLDGLTEKVIGAAIDVHRALGPGLLESTYELCLCRELNLRGVAFERQKPISIEYKGVKLDCGYRADLVVEGAVLVEIKAGDALTAISEAQLLTYLRLGKMAGRTHYQFQRPVPKAGYSAARAQSS